MEIKETWDEIASGWYNLKQKPYPPEIYSIKNWKGSLLDIGCGNARNFILFRNCRLVGVDISKNMLKHAKELCKKNKIIANFVVADFRFLPFKEKFDYIISTAALHHVPKIDLIKALKEIKTLVKKKLFFSVWNKYWSENMKKPREVLEPWKHKGKTYYRYYYLYTKKEFIQVLEKAGFKIIKNLTKKDDKNICVLAGVA